MSEYNVAIVGATGAVGTRMIEMVEQSTLKVKSIKLLASQRSAGTVLQFKETDVIVEETTPESFAGIDLALFSAGGAVSERFAPEAIKRGAVVIDNTSAFRMNPAVPLVVPEVNAEALAAHQGLIANPNCSTIQLVMALEPIRERYGLARVIVTTLQAVSGAGNQAIEETLDESRAYLDGTDYTPEVLPVKHARKHYRQAFNVIPQIDVFEDDGYTHEEWKMIHETKKIMCGGDMNSHDIRVTATCTRVPVPIAHSESVYFEVQDKQATVTGIQDAIKLFDGDVLQDDPANQLYPQPATAEGKRETFIGRIRPDLEKKGAFHLWNVADNLLKGAAWNSVEIAEYLDRMDLLRVPTDNE